jgi:arabinofuranosyltransferase
METAPGQRRREDLARWAPLVVPALVLVVLGLLTLRAQHYFLVDDAYISFRYSRNLAEGFGLVWNPGERVEGYTNLLWVLLLAPLALLRIDLGVAAPILSMLAGIGCLEIVRRISQEMWPDRSAVVRTLPGLLLASNPSMAYWAAQGMETTLFALLVLLSAYLLVRAHAGRRCAFGAGLALAAAALTRPEGLLVAGLLVLVEMVAGSGTLAARVTRVLPTAGIVAVVVGAHYGVRFLYYGEWLPNTYYAKVIWGTVAVRRGLTHAGDFLKAGGFMLLPGVLALGWRPHRAYLVYGYVLLACYTCYVILVGGDLPPWFRFYVPLMPLPLIALSRVLVATADELRRRTFLGNLAPRRPWSTLAALALPALCLAPTPLFWPRTEATLIPFVRNMGEFHTALAAFANRNLARDSLMAVSAVGLVGYRTECRILDLFGLNDRVIAHTKVAQQPGSLFAHEKTNWTYAYSLLPDYILTQVPGRTSMPQVPGYDQCAVMARLPGIMALRRNFPLSEEQRRLGMPAGRLRATILPPPC